jgi:hypothetical protein
MCMIDDCDTGSFSTETGRRARKEHKCGECRRTIARGESYIRAAGYNDGFWTAKMCLHCNEAAVLLQRECSGYVYGSVEEDLEDHARYKRYPWSGEAARLLIGMRRHWRKFTADALMPIPKVARPAWWNAQVEREVGA